jgi:hypothetical protein
MNRARIVALAQEAVNGEGYAFDPEMDAPDWLGRFAALVRAQALSDAAREAERHAYGGPLIHARERDHNDAIATCAAAIRAKALEEAAAVCDKLTMALDNGGNVYRREALAGQCAAAIRRKALQEAAEIARSTCSPGADAYGDGYNRAALDIEDAIRKAGAGHSSARSGEASTTPLTNYPRTPQAIREFIGSHFSARQDAKPAPEGSESIYAGEASEDDVYTLTAHDLLSAVDWWADTAAPDDEEPTEDELQAVCERVEAEFEMVGLSSGLYADYAKEVARRVLSAPHRRSAAEAQKPNHPEPSSDEAAIRDRGNEK